MALDGVVRRWAALDGAGRRWAVLDGIGLLRMTYDGVARHWMALDGVGPSTTHATPKPAAVRLHPTKEGGIQLVQVGERCQLRDGSRQGIVIKLPACAPFGSACPPHP